MVPLLMVEANPEGVSGDWTVVIVVVGAHVKFGELNACPLTVPVPLLWPLRVVLTVAVAAAPVLRPVTVKGSVEPEGVPAEIDPALVDGVQV